MASSIHSRPLLDLPHPARAAAPLVLLGLLALAFAAAPNLPWLAAAGVAALFETAGALRALLARHELARVRRTADRLILHAALEDHGSALVRWRSAELTAPEQREALRREVEHLLRSLSPSRLPSASPVHRPAVRRNVELLRLIADRVGGGRPVSARGMLLVRSLLRDGSSPLYAPEADELLPRALTRILGALEP